jgi:Flp pilus assembly CpaF family ATPase
MTNKEKLIKDIQNLLNTYEGVHQTDINPTLLEFMDEDTLKSIIDNLLTQKENTVDSNKTWLEKFKTV